MTTVSLEEKEFKITTELLTKKYNVNLNSKEFNEITSDFIDPNNKKIFIEDNSIEQNEYFDFNIYQIIQTRIKGEYFLPNIKLNDLFEFDYNQIFIEDEPIEQNECFDFNIYQNIQTRIKGEYFLPNIKLNDLFEFDYNKIFYFLNKDNICTIDKSVSKIIYEIQDKYKTVQQFYDRKVFVLDFNKLDYENPLDICKKIIYYDQCRENLKTKKKPEYQAYPELEKKKVQEAIEMFYKAYQNRYEIAKLKKKGYKFQQIPKLEDKPFEIDKIQKLVIQEYRDINIKNIKINPLNLNLSIFKINKIKIDNVEYKYDDFLVYNGEKFKIVDDEKIRENQELTLYDLMGLILKNKNIDINNIKIIRDYDILYFIYLQFITFYKIIIKYFLLTNQIIKDIRESQLKNYNYSFFQNDDGIDLIKKNYDDYILQFNDLIIGEGGKNPKRTNKTRILLNNDQINEDYKNNILDIQIYNKITNINKTIKINDIIIYQDFYFTLFFQDTITKALNIDYINPLGYSKSLGKQVNFNDEYFYKSYHQVYLLSGFHNSKIFNEMKKDLLFLNFKINFRNKKIIFLNRDKTDITDPFFYFYQDNINYKDAINGLMKSNYNNKLYILNDTYDKLIYCYKKIYGNKGKYKYKNEEYEEYFNKYKEKFLLVYNDNIFNKEKSEERRMVKNIWNLISIDKTTGFITIPVDVKNKISRYKTAKENKKSIFETKLKDFCVSGLKLLDFYYSTLSNEEQFNKNLEEKINEYEKKYKQETENQASEYKIDEDKQNEIIKGYESHKQGTNEQKKEFIQIIKTFIYILFDLLINRIFVNQKFTYSEFIKKVSNIYFGIFNLMFFKSDEKKIIQYKKLLEYYLSYYQVKKINGEDKIYEYNDEKFKTLKDLNDESNIIIDALINSFMFLISENYLTYVITDESIEAIKTITNAYIYYYSLYEQNTVINGQTIIINDGNKDIYYKYQNLIARREELTQEIKKLFKDLNNDPKETIKGQIQNKIDVYNKIKDQITEKENELLNPDVIKQKKEKGFKKVINEDNKEFKEEIKEKYIKPFINLISQMLENEKIIKDEKIKKLLDDKKNYFDDLINNNNINSHIFKDSLSNFYNYKNLRINQHLTNKEVIQYGINESLTGSLIELIKSQQIKKGDYFLISKNKKVKDAYIYLLNDYNDGENEFKIKINNINDFINLLDKSNDKDKENYDIYNFVINNQNNTGALKAKLNELTNDGFKNNQLLGKYKLMQKQ